MLNLYLIGHVFLTNWSTTIIGFLWLDSFPILFSSKSHRKWPAAQEMQIFVKKEKKVFYWSSLPIFPALIDSGITFKRDRRKGKKISCDGPHPTPLSKPSQYVFLLSQQNVNNLRFNHFPKQWLSFEM